MKAVLFDLDYTLYDMSQYLFGAFREIADFLAIDYHADKEYVYNTLVEVWKKKSSYYKHLFNDVLTVLGLNEPNLVKELVKIFHNHCPTLNISIEDKNFLVKLSQNYSIGIITDGNPDMQRKKIEALGVKKLFKIIIYTGELGPDYAKPSSLPYQWALDKLGIKPQEAIYVGDNPQCDFYGANKLGIVTVRVLAGEYKDLNVTNNYEPCYSISRLVELEELLAQLS